MGFFIDSSFDGSSLLGEYLLVTTSCCGNLPKLWRICSPRVLIISESSRIGDCCLPFEYVVRKDDPCDYLSNSLSPSSLCSDSSASTLIEARNGEADMILTFYRFGWFADVCPSLINSNGLNSFFLSESIIGLIVSCNPPSWSITDYET